MSAVLTNFTGAAFAAYHAESEGESGTGGPPTVTGLTPSSAGMGDPDITLEVNGTGFIDSESVIVFNGGEEPTTFVSARKLTTTVKPSTASGPWTVPVTVTGAEGSVDFSFTEPEAPTGTSAEILKWVQGQPARAQIARDSEAAEESPRSTLIAALDKIINSGN